MVRGKPNKTPQHEIDRAKARYRANREAILAAQKAKVASMSEEEYTAYRKACREYQVKYVEENKEKIQAIDIKSRNKNRDRTNRRKREQHAANPELLRARGREWAKKNPEKVRAKSAAQRLNRRTKAGPRLTQKKILEIKALHGDICCYCKQSNATDVEHMLPICRGGTNDYDNLCMACQYCNNSKGKRTVEEFLARAETERTFVKVHYAGSVYKHAKCRSANLNADYGDTSLTVRCSIFSEINEEPNCQLRGCIS